MVKAIGIMQVVVFCSIVNAQNASDFPATDIHLFSIKENSSKQWDVLSHENITNRVGYDNQPIFTANDEEILYSSERRGQTDLYRYLINSKIHQPLTETTPENEFSPLFIPGGNSDLSTVRQNADQSAYLWKLDAKTKQFSLMVPDKNLGYSAWLNADEVVLWVLDANDENKPFELHWVDTRSLQSKLIGTHIGLTIKTIPNQAAVSFVQKDPKKESAPWVLMQYQQSTDAVSVITELPWQVEHYTWSNDGKVIAVYNQDLYRYDPSRPEDGWYLVLETTPYSLGEITRIAINHAGNRVAVVATKE